MKTLLVQDYLRSGNTLDDLAKEHGVYGNITNGKIALNYDMLEAKESDPLACECRGLVLEENTFNIVQFPFKRFFNMDSQDHLIAKDFDWNSAKFFNKMDGTMASVGFHYGKWYIGTRSRCEADVPMEDGVLTFANLFDIAIKEMYNNLFTDDCEFNGNVVNIQDFMYCFGEKAKDY